MGLTLAIAFILLASNFMMINAQQGQQQLLTNQSRQLGSAVTGVPQTATTFQSTADSFRIQVPQGWIIQDVNNTGSALLEESRQGYAMLAQLCPQEGRQQMEEALSNNASESSTNNNTSSNSNNCQGAQEEIVHIIRYPNLSTGIQPINNVTAYHLQKLQEVGYNSIQIVSSTDTLVNITHPQTNETIETVQAKFAEMTYSTASAAPNEMGRGYFLLTATDMTSPNLGTTKGYSVFYEGNLDNNTSTTATAQIGTTSASSSSPPLLLPVTIPQIFDSFELIAALEAAQLIVRPVPIAPNVPTLPTTPGSQAEEEEEEEEVSQTAQNECSPSYPDTCIPPPPPNLNCDDVDDTNFEVVGSDPHGFDNDDDGVGCEDEGGDGSTDDVVEEEVEEEEEDTSCHSSYPDTCIPRPPPNLNCDDVDDTNFEVVGSDPHGFDNDDDGVGCET